MESKQQPAQQPQRAASPTAQLMDPHSAQGGAPAEVLVSKPVLVCEHVLDKACCGAVLWVLCRFHLLVYSQPWLSELAPLRPEPDAMGVLAGRRW